MVFDTIRLTLDHGVYELRGAEGPTQAANVVSIWPPHIAVVDMDLGGEHLLKELGGLGTGSQEGVPVLALTRRGDLKTKLAAFDQGVDDIMTVPFSPEELLARVLAITRRTYGMAPTFKPALTLGDLELDILNRRARVDGEELHLTAVEQSLLYVLAARAGEAVSREELLDAVWGTDFVAGSNVVDRHVRALRAKLQNDWRRPRFIATVPGVGYRFVPEFRERLEAS